MFVHIEPLQSHVTCNQKISQSVRRIVSKMWPHHITRVLIKQGERASCAHGCSICTLYYSPGRYWCFVWAQGAVLYLQVVILRDEGEIQGSALVSAMLTVSTDIIRLGFQ